MAGRRDGVSYNPENFEGSSEGRNFGRIFAVVWLINLTPVGFALRDHSRSDFDPWTVLGWLGLIGFAATYVGIIFLGRPHFISQTTQDVRIAHGAIGALIVIILGFNIAWPGESFELYLIYPGVVSGIYLARRYAVRWLVAITLLYVLLILDHDGGIEDLLQGILLIGGIGVNTVFWTALMSQNRQLRQARAELTRLAVADERLRIARDLHDLLGHSLSLIALKSELAGRLLPSHVDRATTEINDIERVARTSLQEVREAVSGYRTQSLADEFTAAKHILDAAGIALRQTIRLGDPPREIEQVLGWLIRESVTNVIRHANAKSVTISLIETRGRIVAEIEDDGDGSIQRDPGNPGSGLSGLRERVESLDGALGFGDLPGGGFRIKATIPLDGIGRALSASTGYTVPVPSRQGVAAG